MIENGGFEQGQSWWGFSGSAVVSTADQHSGSRSAYLNAETATFGSAGIETPWYAQVPGSSYAFRFWYKTGSPYDNPLGAAFHAQHRNGTGSYVDLFSTIEQVDEWTMVECIVEATDPLGRIRLVAEWPAGTFFSPRYNNWYVDDLELDLYAATLKAALIADLEGIDGTGIYTTAVDEVSVEPVEPQEKRDVQVAVRDMDGSTELGAISSRTGFTDETFTLELFARSTTPHATMGTFRDDVRNAIERTDGNLQNVANVEEATVSGWTEVHTADDIANNWGLQTLLVTVRYRYQRGAL